MSEPHVHPNPALRAVFVLGFLFFALFCYCQAAYATSQSSAQQSDTTSPSATVTPTPTPNSYAALLLQQGDEGDLVISLQSRLKDLGYFNYKITGVFGSMTTQAVKDFQEDNDIEQDGVVGGITASLLYANNATRSLYNRRLPTPTPTPTPKPQKYPTYGKLIEWEDVKNSIRRGERFLVMDFYTKKRYYMTRVGGNKHWDVEPSNADSCAILKATYGGSWSWTRRPILVRIGSTWYAASTNGMPHGYETVSGNNMNGQVCIHFLHSRTHGTNSVDPDHQRCVRIAAGKA